MSTLLELAMEPPPERVRYFPRQLIGADDLSQEQSYLLERFRRHNRLLHGWGVACGCDVRPTPEAGKPWQVTICPGYVLSPQGDEISITSNVKFDVATCLIQTDDPCAYARPCPPIVRAPREPRIVFLAIRYMESPARPTRVAPVGCSCDDASCDFSRVRECYELGCLDTLPSTHRIQPPYNCQSLCAGAIVSCPDKPDDPWVVLAGIRLPAASSGQLVIQTHGRRMLYSTAMLQTMAFCACGGTRAPLVASEPSMFAEPEPAPQPSAGPPPGIATPSVP